MDRPLARMCSDRRDGFGKEPTTLVNRLYGVRTGTQVRKRPSVAVNSFEGFSGGQQRRIRAVRRGTSSNAISSVVE